MDTVVWKVFVLDRVFVFSQNSYVKTTNIMVLGNGIFGRKLKFNEVMRVKPYEWS